MLIKSVYMALAILLQFAKISKHVFMRFGIPIKAYNDLHMQVTASSLLTEKDLIICVSHTGANIDLLQAIELAHNNNVPIIAITSYMNSPLCKLADVVLHGMGRENRL